MDINKKKQIAAYISLLPRNAVAIQIQNAVEANKLRASIENSALDEKDLEEMPIIMSMITAKIAADNGIGVSEVIHSLNYSPYNKDRNPDGKHPSEMPMENTTEFKDTLPIIEDFSNIGANEQFREVIINKLAKTESKVESLEQEIPLTSHTLSHKERLTNVLRLLDEKKLKNK